MKLYAHITDLQEEEVAFPDDEGREITPKSMEDLEEAVQRYANDAAAEAVNQGKADWKGWSVYVEDADGLELFAAPVTAFICDQCQKEAENG